MKTKYQKYSFLFALCMLPLCLMSFGCQPNPLSFQIRGMRGCNASGVTDLSAGGIDIKFRNSYIATLKLANLLGVTGDPISFKSEVNDLVVEKIQVWFEYPKSFSIKGSSDILYEQSKPFEQTVGTLLPASVISGIGGGAVGGGAPAGGAGVAVQTQNIEIELIPPETIALWRDSDEAKNARKNPDTETFALKVTAHIVAIAKNRNNKEFKSQEYVFQIYGCQGCADKREKNKTAKCANVTATCRVGQDGTDCKEEASSQTGTNP